MKQKASPARAEVAIPPREPRIGKDSKRPMFHSKIAIREVNLNNNSDGETQGRT